jgi:ring-1,2-phenylacetyl-CoA epoxidase subunit PaaB
MMIRKFYYGDIPEDAGTGSGSAGSNTGSKNAAASSAVTNTGSKGAASSSASAEPKSSKDWPLWEVFIRSKQGLDHKHMGSLHAADAEMAIENARDVYTRRMEGVSIWVVESKYIHASNPDDAESFYEPANDKVYRHPTFYQLPDELSQM